ncbi:MAG: PAS domain S-box protein, partial [Candidatus Paceibacterota bacterium]
MDIKKALSANQTIVLMMSGLDYNNEIVKVMHRLAGKKIIYVTMNKTYNSLINLFREKGIKTENVVFIDAVSNSIKQVSGQSDRVYYISSPTALTELSLVISKFAKHDFDYLVFDSLTNLFIYEDKAPVAKFFISLVNKIKDSKIKGIFYALSARGQETLMREAEMFVDKVVDLEDAEKAKEEAEEKYMQLFNDAVDAIFVADKETKRLVDCNKAAEKLTGYSRREILSMNASELHPKDRVKDTMEGFRKQAEGKIKLITTEVVTKNKKIIPVEINTSDVKIGDKICMQGIFRDISKEKERNKLKTLWESSNDALMVLEPPNWKFTSCNPSTLKMFNVESEKEFVSLRPWQLSPKYQPDGQLSSIKAKKEIMKAMKKGSNYFRWTHKRYRGKNFPATVLLSRIRENENAYLEATVRDMSKEKEQTK